MYCTLVFVVNRDVDRYLKMGRGFSKQVPRPVGEDGTPVQSYGKCEIGPGHMKAQIIGIATRTRIIGASARYVSGAGASAQHGRFWGGWPRKWSDAKGSANVNALGMAGQWATRQERARRQPRRMTSLIYAIFRHDLDVDFC